MSDRTKEYWSDEISVTYDADRCIHVAECIRGLPEVFDTKKRPWIQPGNAAADQVAAVVVRCPTGALHFRRKDGVPGEAIALANTIRVQARGPLHLRGNLEVGLPGEEAALQDTRVALCRCGHSRNKPFCDNLHRDMQFDASGDLGESKVRVVPGLDTEGRLRVTPQENGPLRVEGDLEIISGDGEVVYEGNRVTLCRCGGSQNKPFCDGSHRATGFHAAGF